VEIQALEADQGRCLGYVRVVGRRRGEVKLADPIVSVATEYVKKPLLRRGGIHHDYPPLPQPAEDV
jgi:hypothetical protein